MAWITIDEAHVRTKLTGPELAALKTSALAQGQANPLSEITAETVNEWRGRLRKYHTLADGATVPDEVASHVVAMIRFRLITRLPSMKSLLDEFRVKEYDNAVSALDKVKEFSFVPAVTPDDESGTQPMKASMNERALTYTRDNQTGLP